MYGLSCYGVSLTSVFKAGFRDDCWGSLAKCECAIIKVLHSIDVVSFNSSNRIKNKSSETSRVKI